MNEPTEMIDRKEAEKAALEAVEEVISQTYEAIGLDLQRTASRFRGLDGERAVRLVGETLVSSLAKASA